MVWNPLDSLQQLVGRNQTYAFLDILAISLDSYLKHLTFIVIKFCIQWLINDWLSSLPPLPLLCLGFLPTHSSSSSQSGGLTHSRSSSKGSVDEILSQPKPKELAASTRQKMLLDYNVYMAKCIPQEHSSPIASPVHSANSSPTATKKVRWDGWLFWIEMSRIFPYMSVVY